LVILSIDPEAVVVVDNIVGLESELIKVVVDVFVLVVAVALVDADVAMLP
jgi:hypothetical protein